MADILQKAAEAYAEVCKHDYRFTLSNGEVITVVFRPKNFAHLAGLRKLDDIYELKNYRATNIYKSALRGELTVYDLQRSAHYNSDARERIENLCRLGYLLQTKQIVWEFDPKKALVHTQLKSNVIFFRDDGFDFYLMLGAVNDGKSYYPETFFLRFDSAYIKGQKIVSIEKLELI